MHAQCLVVTVMVYLQQVMVCDQLTNKNFKHSVSPFDSRKNTYIQMLLGSSPRILSKSVIFSAFSSVIQFLLQYSHVNLHTVSLISMMTFGIASLVIA